eukprot:gene10298-8221_t
MSSNIVQSNRPWGLVAVHVGAGSHSVRKDEQYKGVVKRSCSSAAAALAARNSAMQAVCAAIKDLEDSIVKAIRDDNVNTENTVLRKAPLGKPYSRFFRPTSPTLVPMRRRLEAVSARIRLSPPGKASRHRTTTRIQHPSIANRTAFLRCDDPCTNAGLGSNLTISGTVECDASIMDGGSAAFGAVGASSGIYNPIEAAYSLADSTIRGKPLSCGRVRPMLLAGEGARGFAAASGLTTATPGDLKQHHVTPSSLKAWRKYAAMVSAAESKDTVTKGSARVVNAEVAGHVVNAEVAAPVYAAVAGPVVNAPVAGPVVNAEVAGPVDAEMAGPVDAEVVGSFNAEVAGPLNSVLAGVAMLDAEVADTVGAVVVDAEVAGPLDSILPGVAVLDAEVADTVGAVVVDAWGYVAAGVSSVQLPMINVAGRGKGGETFTLWCWLLG